MLLYPNGSWRIGGGRAHIAINIVSVVLTARPPGQRPAPTREILQHIQCRTNQVRGVSLTEVNKIPKLASRGYYSDVGKLQSVIMCLILSRNVQQAANNSFQASEYLPGFRSRRRPGLEVGRDVGRVLATNPTGLGSP